MKTARPLLVLAALVLVSGCASSTFEPCDFPVTPVPDRQLSFPLLRVGEPASLQVFANQPQRLSSCEETQAFQGPDSVTAQVFDPDNNLVPSEVVLAADGTFASVRFTPAAVGRHHLIVAFAPVGSIQQFDAYVADRWSGATSSVLLPLPRCAQVDRTARGTWLCDGVAVREPNGRQVRLYSGSAAIPDVAVSGNVVWVVGEGRVRRFVDNGTELELTGSLLLNQVVTVKILQSRLVTESELWVMDNLHLHRFIFTDTGVLTFAPAVTWRTGRRVPFGLDGVEGLLVRVAPDRLLAVQVDEARMFDTLACPFQLGPDGAFSATAEPCQQVPGTPVGYEEGVLWTRALNGGQTLYRWTVTGGRLAEQGSLAFDASLPTVSSSLRAGYTVPIVSVLSGVQPGIAAPVPRPTTPPTLALELLPEAGPLGRYALGPRFYFFWTADGGSTGGTRVYERYAP